MQFERKKSGKWTRPKKRQAPWFWKDLSMPCRIYEKFFPKWNAPLWNYNKKEGILKFSLKRCHYQNVPYGFCMSKDGLQQISQMLSTFLVKLYWTINQGWEMNKPFSDIQLLIKFTIQLTFMKELRMYFYNNTNNLRKKEILGIQIGI